ncbi:MAG: PD-(D/E)XK nuclease family protein [Candidatus Dormibacteria bacterium]
MTLSVVSRPSDGSAEWLRRRLAELKAGDDMAAVTLLLPGSAAALSTQRALGRHGVINVRCTVFGRMAEVLAAAGLAVAGRTALRPEVELSLARTLLRHAPPPLRSERPHRALVAQVTASLRRLRDLDLDATQRQEVAARGPVSAGTVAMLTGYEDLLRDRALYDSHDLLVGAAESVTAGAGLGDVGAVLCLQPTNLSSGERRLLDALASRTTVLVALQTEGPADARRAASHLSEKLGQEPPVGRSPAVPSCTHVTLAPNATEEVRAAVRRIIADAGSGIPLHRTALLHSDSGRYAELIRDTLHAAGIPFTLLGGRSLATSHAGRGLIGLLRLRELDFARTSVLRWLSSFPRSHPGVPDSPAWDRLSRRAGVVRRPRDWDVRMRQLGARESAEASSVDDEGEPLDARGRAAAHQARDAVAIADHIAALDAATAPPAERTWSSWSTWVRHLLHDHVVDPHWTAAEQEAVTAVNEIVASITSSGAIESDLEMDTVLNTVEQLLETRRRPEGALGTGVVVGTVSAAAGMEMESVHVLGVDERSFPGPVADDPLLPERGADDLTDDREARVGAAALSFASVTATTGRLNLSMAIWDGAGHPLYPSRWLTEIASMLARTRLSAVRLREHGAAEWCTAAPSRLSALLRAETPRSAAEFRLLSVARRHAAGQMLRGSALAGTPNLPVARGLQVRAARRSAALTAADGNLSDALLDGDQETLDLDLIGDHPQSATRFQEWAECPFRFFLDRVLHVEPTGRPEDEDAWKISPLERGAAIHRMLERYVAELIAQGRPSPDETATPADHARLQAIATEEFTVLEVSGVTGHPLLWAQTRADILADLETLLDRDARLRAQGWTPHLVEHPFGYGAERPQGWEPVTVRLPTGRTLTLRGSIDRLDVGGPGAQPHRLRIIDYKTGKAKPTQKELDADPVHRGRALQLALYADAAGDAFPDVASIDAGYWFASARGGFEYVHIDVGTAQDERLRDVLTGVAGGIDAGAFPQRPGDEDYRLSRGAGWKNCMYCAYDRICPSARDALAERKSADPAVRWHADLTLPPPDDEP